MINYTIDDNKTLSQNFNMDFEALEKKINDIFESIFNDPAKQIASFDVLKIVFAKITPDELSYLGSSHILEMFREYIKERAIKNLVEGVRKQAPKHILFLAHAKWFLNKTINSLFVWRFLTTVFAIKVYAPYIAGYLK